MEPVPPATRVPLEKGVALARLLHLVSPSLPVGAFAYSRGLEQAVELGWVRDAATTSAWVSGLLLHSLARVDGPVLVRAYRGFAEDDAAALDRWASFLAAHRETAELREEDRIMGGSLARLLTDLGLTRAERWVNEPRVAFVIPFALAAVEWRIPLEDALFGYLFSTVESQIGAAIRLVPLGQTAGHRVLAALDPLLVRARALALELPDDAIGATTHGLAIASALHETAYARLFRS